MGIDVRTSIANGTVYNTMSWINRFMNQAIVKFSNHDEDG